LLLENLNQLLTKVATDSYLKESMILESGVLYFE